MFVRRCLFVPLSIHNMFEISYSLFDFFKWYSLWQVIAPAQPSVTFALLYAIAFHQAYNVEQNRALRFPSGSAGLSGESPMGSVKTIWKKKKLVRGIDVGEVGGSPRPLSISRPSEDQDRLI